MAFVRKLVLLIFVLALVGLGAFFVVGSQIADKMMNKIVAHEPYPVSEAALALHKTLIIGDWHDDALMWDRDLTKRSDYGHVDFPRMAEGNVALQMFTTVTKSPAGLNYDENFAETRDQITLVVFGQLWPFRTWTSLTERALYQSKKLHDFQAKAPEMFRIVRTKGDLQAVLDARAAGTPLMGALMGAEGGHALDGNIANLARLDAAGFRMIGLQHFFDNALGGSLHGISQTRLTDFGRQVVAEMISRNMIVDLAHTSAAVARDVLEFEGVNVVVSHTGIFSHCETKRNFPDDLMQAIAAKGGLIAIGFWADVTCDASPTGVAKTIVAAINLVGANHVSLGSDYDGTVEVGFDPSEMAALTHALLEEGVSEDDIRAVMGGNMVRYLLAALPE